jgi:ADP-ribose pyrophosphatase
LTERIPGLPRRLRLISRKTIYQGRTLELNIDRVIEPGGVTANREVVRHTNSVVVLPELNDGRVLLVAQYRYAVRRRLWELVAGGIEPGETPAEAAHRELLEESGYRARTVRLLVDFYASPGFSTERMFLFQARGLGLSKATPEADEQIRVGRFSLAQLQRMLRAKVIRDGKTLVGLLWRFGSLRSAS